ncbi:adenylate/guanylate cyclase domain-containing protein [Salinimicrobium gaetbulicola]|uniref:Adenylate/guanylate cyclase domain-containing protein n=1 Tax=Salinimicrobium gaetbulicola TaxID=999702 RepID=A0ABW3ICD7_9FLAO
MFKWKKACLITGLFYFLFFSAASQNRERVNELINQISSDNDLEELVILKEKTEKEVNPDLRLEYAELLIKKAAEDSLLNFLHSGYLQKGNALQLKGDYAKALEAFFQSLELAYKIGEPKGIGALMVSIADTYNMSGNSTTSQQYYKKAIGILRTTNDSVTLASGLLNAGDAAFTNKDYAKALEYFEESGLIFKEINYPLGIAYNLGNVGMVYAEQGKHELAKNNINESIAILEELKDYYPISVFLRYMADIYAKQNDLPTSFSYAERSLDLAISNGLKDQISESNLLLANLSSQAGNYEKAYNFFKDHITYRDSITNVQTVQQMAELRADSEVSQKQAEVDLLAQQKRTQNIIVLAIAVALFLLSLIALGLYRRNKFVNRTKRVIEKEKKRSDLLLRNILPEETAQELKEYGKVKSKRFESVTVLFTDFKDFTMYAETATPEELVESVDYYFSNFDDIIDKYGLEKIKTVGDAYMCAGGLPFPIRDHALNVVLAALEMVEFVSRAKQNVERNILKFDIRIGISSGPVVAGVVGKKKFVYDIWGDTVNIASRMESNCGTGRVNISENTFELIRDHCQCDYRGEIKAKNKGMMKMYYVSGIEIKKDESHSIQSPITA